MILTALDEHSVLSVLVRVPYEHHDSVRATCRQFRDIARSHAFRLQREASGCVESFVVVAGGYDKAHHRHRAECWALVGRRWRALPPLPEARDSALVAARGREMFVFGGLVGAENPQPGGRVETNTAVSGVRYCAAENQWRACAPMPRRHGGGAVGALTAPARRDEARDETDLAERAPREGRARVHIVVAGGYEQSDQFGPSTAPRAHVDAYDPERDAWAARAPMPRAVSGAASGAVGGGARLLIAGGGGLEAYDAAADAWSAAGALADPPQNLMASTAGRGAVVDGRLWVAGGFDENSRNSAATFSYDEAANRWHAGPKLPNERSAFRAVGHRGTLVVVGGGPPLVLVGGLWSELPPLPLPVDFPAVASVVFG